MHTLHDYLLSNSFCVNQTKLNLPIKPHGIKNNIFLLAVNGNLYNKIFVSLKIILMVASFKDM